MATRALFLVGFMGSGKNTVGCELARRLGWNFVDLDAEIEAREGQRVPEIFSRAGESGFRAAEHSTLCRLLARLQDGTVVALGGGAFVQEKNREMLRPWPTIFLNASVEELWRRCEQDGNERPMRKDPEQFARLYRERLPYYLQSSVIIETSGKDPNVICQEIEFTVGLGRDSEGAVQKSPLRRS